MTHQITIRLKVPPIRPLLAPATVFASTPTPTLSKGLMDRIKKNKHHISRPDDTTLTLCGADMTFVAAFDFRQPALHVLQNTLSVSSKMCKHCWRIKERCHH